MSVSQRIQTDHVANIMLDPTNPRLGRDRVAVDTNQETLLKWMGDFTLDELGASYAANGEFWTYEPPIVVEEELYGEVRKIVVEGNRRIAAIKQMYKAARGDPESPQWNDFASGFSPDHELFTAVPFLKADKREDVWSFMGFRHVTGIKQWDADEKAAFIAKLIESGMSYEEVMRKVGSKTPTVRSHYIAFRTLLQIEDLDIDMPQDDRKTPSDRFTVLRMSLNTTGAQQFLKIDMESDPETAKRPVPKEAMEHLKEFAKWLFGGPDTPALVNDTRKADGFGKILSSPEALDYLRNRTEPNFDTALQLAGGELDEVTKLVSDADENVEQALTRIHAYKSDANLTAKVTRFAENAVQLIRVFPKIREIHKLPGD